MSLVIARRYRPQTFAEVIGQDPITRTLRNAITSGRIAHGFIFSGHRGIGKTSVARILAKALNCRNAAGPTPTPCGECDSCREIRDGSAMDVIEIDAASNRGIDEIRALRDRVRFRPARDRYKFFILDEAHQLTGDAFNALLKTLEEPPEWAVFVLATTEPEALPATIRSRCQHFSFRAVPFAQILTHLESISGQEKIPAEREALELIAEAGEGSVRDALSVLEQAITYGDGKLDAESVRALLGRVSSSSIRALLEAVAGDTPRDVLAAADALLAAGVSPAQLCWQLTQAVRNTLLAQCDPNLLEVSESEKSSAEAMAQRFSQEDLTRFLQILLRCAADLRHGEQERFHLELALLKLVHARRLASLEGVLAALDGSSPSPAPAPQAQPKGIPERPSPVRSSQFSVPAPLPSVPSSQSAVPSSSSPTAEVLAHLESQKRSSFANIFSKARWNWGDNSLDLVFPAAQSGLASLAGQPDFRKILATAAQAVTGRNLVISVATGEEGEAGEAAPASPSSAAPASPGSVEERAEQHPMLRRLKEKIPSHVLKTRALS